MVDPFNLPRSERSADLNSDTDSCDSSDQGMEDILIDSGSEEESKNLTPQKANINRKPRASKYLHLPPNLGIEGS